MAIKNVQILPKTHHSPAPDLVGYGLLLLSSKSLTRRGDGLALGDMWRIWLPDYCSLLHVRMLLLLLS